MIAPFHKGDADPLHRMLNAIQPHSYVRPHRHLDPPKAEAWVVVRGAVAFFTFEADGAIRDCARIGPGEPCWGVDLVPGVYHGLVALEPDTVLYEVKTGPYAALTDKAFAPFAPLEGTPEAEAYRSSLLKAFEARHPSWRPPQLTAARVMLRGYELHDAEAIFAYSSDIETTRHMAWDTHTSLRDTQAFLNGWVAQSYRNRQLDYAICLREQPQQVIGGIGVIADNQRNSQLGYILKRELWGSGLMVEAAKLLLNHVFSETDAARVFAPIYTDNARSRAFAEKLGMQLEGILRSSCERHGQRKDQAIYSLLTARA
jgi:cupin fold WbuC family metalloprotein